MSSDQELKQLKLVIKTWESDFTKSEQRKPLKVSFFSEISR